MEHSMMDGNPRLLVWDYTEEEKTRLDQFLEEVKAPPAVSIRKDQGYLLLHEIIHNEEKQGDQEFECDEKIVLFYNIPSKGMSFLIDRSKQRNLPSPIYAAVTEHSITWPFNELLQDLIAEREAFREAARQAQEQTQTEAAEDGE